ncbi:SIP domain-containing protein [Actinocorallia longicatena]|uniref:FAD-binding FR-type domain-containing protein n=1 Tax=Actinocorallia longicatena TaxID=111803 RepID=A0ABP6PVP1_9ACTN
MSSIIGTHATAIEALIDAGAHGYCGGQFADVGDGSGAVASTVAGWGFTVTSRDGSQAVDLPEGVYDVVHSSWLLERLADPLPALRDMAKAVAPGGLLVLQWDPGTSGTASVKDELAETGLSIFSEERTGRGVRLLAGCPDPDDGQSPDLVRPFPQAVGVLEVVEVLEPTPLMRRLVLRCDELHRMEIAEPGEIITLIWPIEGAGEIVLPERGKWSATPGQHSRNYTVRAFDRAAGLVTVDFFLHAIDGRASRWARAAVPGDQVGFAGCRVHWVGDPAARWTLLVGDETALPSIAAIALSRPEGHRTIVVAEVRDPAEHAYLEADGVEIHWLDRGEREPGRGREPEELVRGLDLPSTRGRVWAAGESLVIQSLRAHFLTERGLPKETVTALGYWHHPRRPRVPKAG